MIRFNETKSKWIFCDPDFLPQCVEAANLIEWPVEIIVFGEVNVYTSVEDFFNAAEDETGKNIMGFFRAKKISC